MKASRETAGYIGISSNPDGSDAERCHQVIAKMLEADDDLNCELDETGGCVTGYDNWTAKELRALYNKSKNEV